jgi:hypothetical protein
MKNWKNYIMPSIEKETPHIQFHPRIVNHTGITFTADELALLEKGISTTCTTNQNIGYVTWPGRQN